MEDTSSSARRRRPWSPRRRSRRRASCYACHATHTAVENTFVQFYPTLFEVAREKGTIKPTYDPNRKVQ